MVVYPNNRIGTQIKGNKNQNPYIVLAEISTIRCSLYYISIILCGTHLRVSSHHYGYLFNKCHHSYSKCPCYNSSI